MARARHVDRYTRDYTVRVYSRATGADLTVSYGVTRHCGTPSDGVTISATSRRALTTDRARDAVLDYYIGAGYPDDFLLDLRIVVAPTGGPS